jgi:gliding motility-associated-like protein
VTFTDLSTGTNGSSTYFWDFGIGASPATANTAGNVTVTYSISGLKTVTLTIVAGITKTITRLDYIDVAPLVTLDRFSPATSTRCQGAESITYSTTATSFAKLFYTLDPVSLAAGNTIDTVTGSVNFTPNWSGITIITASASGCGEPASTTHAVTSTPLIVPVFDAIGPLLQNSAAPPLPAKSINNIAGTWSPESISTSEVKTTTYTFIPDTGQCASSAAITVSVTSGNCPDVDLGKDRVVCSTIPITLSGDDGTGEIYLWSRIENFLNITISTSVTAQADRTAYYILSVTKNACTITDTVHITMFDPQLSGIDSVSTKDNTCFGGQNGAIEIFMHDTGIPYQYSIDGGERKQNKSLFENLRSGDYRIQVSEDSVCFADYSVPVSIGPVDSIQIEYRVRSPRCKTCRDGRLNLVISGGWGGYLVTLSGIPVEAVTESLAIGDYTLSVTDARGCTKTVDIEVEEINIPNVITTNGDGLNDLWKIPVLSYYPDAIVKVYTIGGKMVMESEKGYPFPWDGKNNGVYLPSGTYYYLINLGSGDEQLSGYLTILR